MVQLIVMKKLAGCLLLAPVVACGAAAPGPSTTPPSEGLRCPDEGMACAFVEWGNVECCARGADGVAAAWRCPEDTGGRQVATPRPVGGLTGAVEVAPMASWLCARLADGTVRCFGNNDDGTLGLGHYLLAAPVLRQANPRRRFGDHRCVRAPDGTVRCWPADEAPPPLPECRAAWRGGDVYTRCQGLDPNALCRGTAIALPVVGLDHATALFGRCALQDGEVLCWGLNERRELNTKRPTYGVPVAMPLTGLDGPVAYVEETCAVLAADGRVQCWGEAADSPATELVGVEQLGLVGGSGGSAGCARIYGGVRCWGLSGEPSEVKPVELLEQVAQIGVGAGHACALLDDGSVHCWGRNQHGQLGDGTTEDRPAPAPAKGIGTATQLAVGSGRTCARLADGAVSCWGRLPGPDGPVDEPTPVRIDGLPPARRVALGGDTLCAIVESTQVYCWGDIYAPTDPVPRGGNTTPLAGPPAASQALPEDGSSREPPRPPSTTCTRSARHCLGQTGRCTMSEDECLDIRAGMDPPRPVCTLEQTLFVRRIGPAGNEIWTCACRGDDCRRCRPGERSFERCSRRGPGESCAPPDPATGERITDEQLATRCDGETIDQAPAASKSPDRFCVQGAMALHRSCPPPPPDAGPDYCRPVWQAVRRCYRTRQVCEEFRRQSALHLPDETDPRCERIPPK